MEKNLKRIFSILGVSVLCLSTSSYAATTYSKQTVTVPKLGSSASSKSEVKSVTNKEGNIMNPTVGGGYTLTARMTCQASTGLATSVSTSTGTLNVGSTTAQKAGYNATLGFKTTLTTPVNVNVTAQMRCN